MWDGSSWGLLGGAAASGSVASCLTVGSRLFVAGSFVAIGGES